MVQGACQLTPDLLRPATAPRAPFWHTRALTWLLLAVAIAGTALSARGTLGEPAPQLSDSYWSLLVVNLGLAFYAARLGLERSMFWQLVGWTGRRHLARNLAGAAALIGLVLGTEGALQLGFGMPESLFAHALLPALPSEKLGWVLLAVVIGGSEELVYRGYLRQQLQALSGSRWLAGLLQALLFGIAHGAQGQWAVARFAVYGAAFGYVAQRQRSIVPCVLGHVGLDLYAGLAG
jgi:membrane protease YdiL (CAAX protease family)